MKQLNKTFLIVQFGKPHEWTQRFIDHVQHLEQYGWYFKIITPNDFQSVGNVEIVTMNIKEFNTLCKTKVGVNPKLLITKKGIPSFHITDLMIYFGAIFEDYLKNADFWGLIGLDCVVGRLDHFVPDSLLLNADIYSDDIQTFNGNFSLMRNTQKINTLFQRMGNWHLPLSQSSCKGCTGKGRHTLYGTDEYLMTNLLKDSPDIKFVYPESFFIHGHDRLEIHIPKPKLTILTDGSLWEKIHDVNQPEWEHAHDNFGHEIAYFHFSQTKKWPF